LLKNKYTMSYYANRIIETTFTEAVDRVTASLKARGFGIITDIDLRQTFRNKLDKEFRQYRILGACNPQYAFEALALERNIGTMLPCNVIVQELDNGKIEVSAVDPVASMAAVDNPQLHVVAAQVAVLLKAAVEEM
jgi:uncharacterized protein (DUF302 family)